MDTNSGERHRTRERIPCNIEVVINDSVVCKAFDISEGGLYVNTRQSFNPGSVVRVTFDFRDEKIEIKSRVKYCQKGVGIGLMFIDLDNTLIDKITELIIDIKEST